MSFIAGVVSLGSEPLADQWRTGLRDALPKAPDLSPFEFDERGALLVQFDFGAFTHPGYQRAQSRVAILAGHPFFPEEICGPTGSGRGVGALPTASEGTLHELAARSAGNWCAARWNESDRELTLLGDRLASRPVYWWSKGTEAAFASTLSVLEKLLRTRLQIDHDGLLETVRLGYPLADRTPYQDVRRLLAGEIVVLGPGRLTRDLYWDWARWPQTDRLRDLPEQTLGALRRAVERRLDGRTRATTFLSGGMDSRVINQLLVDEGVHIRSFNFSRPGSQDAELGRAFAQIINTEHVEEPRKAAGPVRWTALLANASRTRGPQSQVQSEPAWSGDGGSVCAGWVYVNPGIVGALRSGDVSAGIREHLEVHGSVLGRSAIRRRARDWVSGRVEGAIQQELNRYAGALDPARRFFLFMVENDQRRHLDAHFEDILEHRLELWTPFLDGAFLEIALAVPVDVGVGHGLYDRWFGLLPDSARSVPWQTYPGHVPCPLPMPDNLLYQWRAGARRRPWRWRELRTWSGLILSSRFPSTIFRRSTALTHLALYVLRIRDQRGWMELLQSFSTHWNRADHSRLPW